MLSLGTFLWVFPRELAPDIAEVCLGLCRQMGVCYLDLVTWKDFDEYLLLPSR